MAITSTDTHAHVFQPGLPAAPGARYVPDYAATVEDYLGTLDDNGMDRGVLVQPSFLGSDNDYLLTALAAAPDRLRGVIMVDHEALDQELCDERVALLTSAGVRGVRLNLIGRDVPDLSSTRWRAAGRAMVAHGWHLEVQATPRQWGTLQSGVSSWPGPVVVDHLGLPHERPAVDKVIRLSTLPHIWVKVSAPYRSSYALAAHTVARLVSNELVDRLLFGSDWPFTQHETDNTYDALTGWVAEQVGDTVWQKMLTTNPDTLLGW